MLREPGQVEVKRRWHQFGYPRLCGQQECHVFWVTPSLGEERGHEEVGTELYREKCACHGAVTRLVPLFQMTDLAWHRFGYPRLCGQQECYLFWVTPSLGEERGHEVGTELYWQKCACRGAVTRLVPLFQMTDLAWHRFGYLRLCGQQERHLFWVTPSLGEERGHEVGTELYWQKCACRGAVTRLVPLFQVTDSAWHQFGYPRLCGQQERHIFWVTPSLGEERSHEEVETELYREKCACRGGSHAACSAVPSDTQTQSPSATEEDNEQGMPGTRTAPSDFTTDDAFLPS